MSSHAATRELLPKCFPLFQIAPKASVLTPSPWFTFHCLRQRMRVISPSYRAV